MGRLLAFIAATCERFGARGGGGGRDIIRRGGARVARCLQADLKEGGGAYMLPRDRLMQGNWGLVVRGIGAQPSSGKWPRSQAKCPKRPFKCRSPKTGRVWIAFHGSFCVLASFSPLRTQTGILSEHLQSQFRAACALGRGRRRN